MRTEDHSAGGHARKRWTEQVHHAFLERIARRKHRNELWDSAVHISEILTAGQTSAATNQQPIQVGGTEHSW